MALFDMPHRTVAIRSGPIRLALFRPVPPSRSAWFAVALPKDSMPGPTLPPPPPPPAYISGWPDRSALLADRGRALEELRRRSLGVHRVLLLWLLAVAAIIGWALLVLPLQQLEQRDPTGFILGPLFAVLGLASLAPSVVAVVLAVRRDRHISQLLDAWLRLDSHPPTDDRLRSSGLSLFWLLSSLTVCAFGLWTSFAGVAEARPGRDAYSDVVLVMGIGFILWLTGLIGVAKAVRHYRWAVRVLGPRVPAEQRATASPSTAIPSSIADTEDAA
ncbi:hypothetical protein [Streptomyces sp. NPDC050982]|uniref:hypothetical protein n=1 Tax=Streptomyces sp. NPDC050982 TaxID=3154746 RepID=UPI0033C3F786